MKKNLETPFKASNRNISRGGVGSNWSKPGKLSLLIGLSMLLSPNLMVNAQFVAPVTPDAITGCTAVNVENTGTSAIGDLQVIVWDGDVPGIAFIDHAGSPVTALCFPLIAHLEDYLVKDPDVVWDFANSDLALVVYEEYDGTNSTVWSQMWRWNSGSPALETSYGTGGYYQLSQGTATYPNIDADYAERATAVWQEGTDIYAMTINLNTLTPSGHHFWVNDNACQQPGTEPDVPMRQFDDDSYVSFVYADPTNIEIIVAQEYYGSVESSSSTCNFTQLQKPTGVTIDYVGVPRIAMPNWEVTGVMWYDGWDAGVVYEGKNSSDYLIITANRTTHWAGWIPTGPTSWLCLAHTYSSPAFASTTGTEWISDILNVSGIGIISPTPNFQINPPTVDLINSGSLRPVVAQAGDFITYNSWDWSDVHGLYSSYDEILMRRLMLNYHTSFTSIAVPGGLLSGNYNIPSPTTSDYFVVSDGQSTNPENKIVSITGTSGYAYFAYVAKGSTIENMVFKRTVHHPTAAVRKRPTQFYIRNNEPKTAVYPNPFSSELIIENSDSMQSLTLSNINGKIIISLNNLNSNILKLNANEFNWNPGIYFATITSEHGIKTRYKLIYQP